MLLALCHAAFSQKMRLNVALLLGRAGGSKQDDVVPPNGGTVNLSYRHRPIGHIFATGSRIPLISKSPIMPFESCCRFEEGISSCAEA